MQAYCSSPTIFFGTTQHTRKEPQNGRGLLLVGGKVYPFAYAHSQLQKHMLEAWATSAHYPTKPAGWDFSNPYKLGNEDDFDLLAVHRRKRNKRAELVTGARYQWAQDICATLAPIILITAQGALTNPRLKHMHPPLDPFTAVQDITATLMSVEPPIPDISNEDKVSSAGFVDSSFRKRPSSTPKRRKHR